MAKQREYNFLIYISRIYKICSSRKYSPPAPPMEGSFALDPHLLEFPWGCLSSAPPSQISVIFQLGWVPSGKNISIKNVVALYYIYAKDNFFL